MYRPETIAAGFGKQAVARRLRHLNAQPLSGRARAIATLCAILMMVASEPLAGANSIPGATTQPVAARRAAPTGAPLRTAQKQIRDLYAAELAKHDTGARRSLYSTLLKNAPVVDKDPVVRYAMLEEAHSLALSTGDLEEAFAAVEKIAADYDIDAFAMKDADFSRHAPALTALPGREEARQLGRDLAEQALASGHSTAASHIAEMVESMAAGRSAALVGSTRAWAGEINSLAPLARAGWDALHKRTHETDRRAATAAGIYLCIIAGDWKNGLPYLSRGSDAALASVAKTELEADTGGQPAALSSAAAAWLDYATKQSAATRGRWAGHALTLYQICGPQLHGIEHAAAEKREAEATEMAAGSWVIDLLALADPSRDAIGDMSSWQSARGLLMATGGETTRLQLPYHVPAEYDFTVDFTRTKDTNDVFLVLSAEGHSFQFDLGSHGGKCWFGAYDGKGWGDGMHGTGPLRNDVRHRCTMQVRKNGCRAFLDGVLAMSIPGSDYSVLHSYPDFSLNDPQCLGFGCWHCTTVFQIAEVVEIHGHGQIIDSPTPEKSTAR